VNADRIDPDDELLDRLADRLLDRLAEPLGDRLAARLGGLPPVRAEALVSAAEIARQYGKTRSWVYDHSGELGAVRLGDGKRPRLAFSPTTVAATIMAGTEPALATAPARPPQRPAANRTRSGAQLLPVRPRAA
jgi:hypothetical protein